MFNLAYPIDDTVEIDGFKATVDMSFDNILRLFDMLADEDVPDSHKLDTALEMLVSEPLDYDTETRLFIYTEIMNAFIVPADMKASAGGEEEVEQQETRKYYNIAEDAEYIYSSFMQDYQIDLFEEQGRLHWDKFKALLGGLKEGTKFKEVVRIRQWKPTKDTSEEEKRQMKELQAVYALSLSQEEADFESMDLLQKQEYAKKKMAQENQG